MTKQELIKKYQEIVLNTNGGNDDYVVALCQIGNLINELDEPSKEIAELKKQLEEKDKKIETLQTHFKKAQELLGREMYGSNIVLDNLQKEMKQALANQKDHYEKKLNTQPREIVEKIKSKMDNTVDTLINLGNGKEDAVAWFCGILEEILKEYGGKDND